MTDRMVEADFDCKIKTLDLDRQTAIEIGANGQRLPEGTRLRVRVSEEGDIKFSAVKNEPAKNGIESDDGK